MRMNIVNSSIAIVFAFLFAVHPGNAQAPLDSPKLTVTIVGSGGGPRVNLQRYGPSILVQAGDQTLLFDCGRGATIRLTEMGIPLPQVDKVFLIHLHSDHVIGLPDLLLSPWAAPGRVMPLEVWGPAGTQEMMEYLSRAFSFDIRIRGASRPVDGVQALSHDVDEGIIFDRDGVKVTAILVDHGPTKPALGYRVDYGEHSVALSGDTRFSENLISAAEGVDVLIHEAFEPPANMANQERLERLLAQHVSVDQMGEIFTRVNPRLAVYAHAASLTEDGLRRTREAYSGRVIQSEDLMTIEIGDSIEVIPFERTR